MKTDAEFKAWLADPNAERTILFETVANVNGVDVSRYLCTRGFVSSQWDSPANTPYLAVVVGGIEFTARIALDGGSAVGFGDIELDNTNGDLDSWLNDIWHNKPCRAYIGDVKWARMDFRMIFDGVLAGADSVNRNRFNLLVRDKLARLDNPISEVKLGGTGPKADTLVPVTFGEVHNVTPILEDGATLKYKFHVANSEACIEVRDAGVPLADTQFSYFPLTANVQLQQKPYGDITLSVQGDKTDGYKNRVAPLASHVLRNYGTEPQMRFTVNDIDEANFSQFDLLNPQPVGLYADSRMTVRDCVDAFAASVGARLSMSFTGKARLVKIALPPTGTPLSITESDMVAGSLQIADRLPVRASVKVAYCKNWTVQTNLPGLIPEEHKNLFNEEWLYASASDPDVAADYGLWEEAEPEQTLLLRKIDAQAEAGRRLNLRKVQRTVYEFVGFADLLFLDLGTPIMLRHWRFGLDDGVLGQVISVAVDWVKLRVRVGVLV